MQDKKETRPTLAGAGQARPIGAIAWQATRSDCDSITDTEATQAVRVSDFLLRGRANAMPMRHLRDLLHIPPRKVRLMIRRERLEGVPILESSHPLDGGYFLPGDEAEQARCIQEMRRRAAEIIETADAIEGGRQHG